MRSSGGRLFASNLTMNLVGGKESSDRLLDCDFATLREMLFG